jgi:hypothetical protein
MGNLSGLALVERRNDKTFNCSNHRTYTDAVEQPLFVGELGTSGRCTHRLAADNNGLAAGITRGIRTIRDSAAMCFLGWFQITESPD